MAIQFGSVAVLARLLVPADFGLVAMVAAVVGVAELLRDFGLSTAAVQSPTLSDDERTNLFWANAAAGLGCAVLAACAAPLVVLLYDEPRVQDITLAIAPLFLLNGLATQFRAGLARQLRFASLGLSDLVAQALSAGVTVGLAVAGAGVWALVAGMLVNSAAAGVLFAVMGGWCPGWPRRRTSIRRYFGFGAGVLGTQAIGYLTRSVDNVAIGVVSGAAPLGLYGRAYQLMTTPLANINAPMNNVVLPVLRHTQSDDELFLRYLARAQLVLLYTTGFVFAISCGLADPIVLVVFGDGWTGVAPILAVLAVAGPFRALAAVPWWAYLARGHSGALFRQRTVTGVLSVLAIFAGLPWGAVGVAWGVAAGSVLAWAVGLWHVGRVTRLDTSPLVTRVLLTLTLVALPCGLAAHTATWVPAPPLVQLVVGVGAAATYFLTARLLLPLVRSDVRVVLSFARRGLPVRRRRTGGA
ncbi:lipopolysaccharide biosynthesis protein [Nocardioides sp. HDW12B]|nr:lipopolysaccharide biosynthesis protein [Nocardioides sp. HDW12B]